MRLSVVGDDALDAASLLGVADAADLDRASLQRRVDRKFLLEAQHAAEALAAVAGDYRVVLAREERFALYDTTYFDTASLRCYDDHRRRRRPRFKARARHYVDRDLSMLEYKEKTARGDTRKARWKRPAHAAVLTDADAALLAGAKPDIFDEGPLVPQARTVFRRLTLVHATAVERATMDFGLVLERGDARRVVDVVVVEVKAAGRGAAGALMTALRRQGARPLSFSKYCAAVALLGGARANTFLPALRAAGLEP